MSFLNKLDKQVKKNNSLLCIGLDSDLQKLPKHLKSSKNAQFKFNKAIIDATCDLVSCYKANSAFYEAEGAHGIEQLKKSCDYLSKQYPEIPFILDAKRADIGNTNNGYVKFAFEYLNVDAITLSPYLGREAIQPFLDYRDRGCIILCKTSNPGSGELQNLKIKKQPLYRHVAEIVTGDWDKNNNCLLVVGATYPKELAEIRSLAPNMVFLIPGIGSQKGDLKETLKAGLNSKNTGLIIHSARDIIFASDGRDFIKRARESADILFNAINTYR